MLGRYKQLVLGILIGAQVAFMVSTALSIHSSSPSSSATYTRAHTDDDQRRALSVAPEKSQGKKKSATANKIGNHEKQIQTRAEANSKISHFEKSTKAKGLSACLYTSDDRIRLIEWIPYHFTVLPLDHLIVAIDPANTKYPERIINVLERWQNLINITIITDDQVYLQDVPYDKAWKRKYWFTADNGTKVMNPFHFDKTTFEYKSQAHKRRQNVFTSYCHRQHHIQGHDWVINLDTDEFLIPNYPENNQETAIQNSSNFFRNFVKTSTEIERERSDAMDIREHLPHLDQHITVADILAFTDLERCLRMPALNFSAHTSEQQNPNQKLLTLTQRHSGPKEGRTTKVLLDVSRASLEYLTWQKVVNVHNPNKRMCGWQGVMGSGTDYISSIFRYNHYVVGSLESYLERQGDFRRGSNVLEQFHHRNFEPESSDNVDILDWVPWFEQKVGLDAAHDLLYGPLTEAYADMQPIIQQQLSTSELSNVKQQLRYRRQRRN